MALFLFLSAGSVDDVIELKVVAVDEAKFTKFADAATQTRRFFLVLLFFLVLCVVVFLFIVLVFILCGSRGGGMRNLEKGTLDGV